MGDVPEVTHPEVIQLGLEPVAQHMAVEDTCGCTRPAGPGAGTGRPVAQWEVQGCRSRDGSPWEGGVAGSLLCRPHRRPHRLGPQWEESLLGWSGLEPPR